MLKFRVGGLSCALPVTEVQEITAMVWITPLPGAGSNLVGVIDCHGTPCPVVDVRYLLNLPSAEIDPGQQLLVLRLGAELLAIPCDRAETVLWGDIRPVAGGRATSNLIRGLVQGEDGVTLVLDSAHLMKAAPVGERRLRQLIRAQRVAEITGEAR
jgi:purine-binding chemotaxis protein CheW